MSGNRALSAETVVRQLEILAVKMEDLADMCPQLKHAGYVQRIRASASHLTAAPESLVPAITASWLQLAALIDEVKANLLLVAPLQNSACQQRAICDPQPCPSSPTQGQVDDVLIAAAAAQIPATIAQGVADAIPEPFNAYAVAIATGLTVVVNTLSLTAAILQKSLNEIAACEEAAFHEVVYSMCDTINQIKESLDRLHCKVDLLDRKADILLRIAAEIAALGNEIMLREIEENLAACRPLASLYLPEADGGRLETIQRLLYSLINASKTAGLESGAAESHLKQGVAASLRKDYCEAFTFFALSYRQLTANACCAFHNYLPPRIPG